MFQIQTLNKISSAGLARFPADGYAYGDQIQNPDGILVRSASMLETEMPRSLKAIARAGAGVNNIPVDRCSEAGIVVFNTPGANANAVKELVLAGLFLSSRKVTAAVNWAKTLIGQGDQVAKLVEKGKGQFAGPEIAGKKLGVIGLGAIGVLVANAATHLDMEVYGYDPFISVDCAWRLSRSVKRAKELDEIFSQCDYITIHVPQTPDTKGMINKDTLEQMKDGVRILNFARGSLVEDKAILEALEGGKAAAYITDFPNETLLKSDKVISIPHLGASTPESEENCAFMAVDQLMDYLETGNIRNSVNLPAAQLPLTPGAVRVCIIHKNVPHVIRGITEALSGVNIEHMLNKSKGDYAYTMCDVTGSPKETLAPSLEDLEALESVIRVRVI